MDDRDDEERLNVKKEVKIQFRQELESYLEEEKVHDIFQEMMTCVIKERPDDPIDFLIKRLTRPESKCS